MKVILKTQACRVKKNLTFVIGTIFLQYFFPTTCVPNVYMDTIPNIYFSLFFLGYETSTRT